MKKKNRFQDWRRRLHPGNENFLETVSFVSIFGPCIFSAAPFILTGSLIGTSWPELIEAVIITNCGFWVGLSIYSFMSSQKDAETQEKLVADFLVQFEKCKFERINSLKPTDGGMDVLKEASHATINVGRVRIADYDHEIKLYLIEKGTSKTLPNQLVAFSSDVSVSYLFVRDRPEALSPIGKFFLFHEVGHCSWQSSYVRTFHIFGWKQFAMIFPWMLINIKLEILPIILLCIYFVILLRSYFYNSAVLAINQAYEEVNADLFAARLLSKDERSDVFKHLKNEALFSLGSQIDKKLVAARIKRLANGLSQKTSGGDKENPLRVIFDSQIERNQLILSIAIPILGIFSRPLSVEIVLFDLLFAFICYQFMLKAQGRREKSEAVVEKLLA